MPGNSEGARKAWATRRAAQDGESAHLKVMRNLPFWESLPKQNRRNDVLADFVAAHQDFDQPVRAIGFPGLVGFENPNGLERSILRLYKHPNTSVIGLEQDPEVFLKAKRDALALKDSRAKMVRSRDLTYFRWEEPRPSDLIFLDWMNGLSEENWETIETILSRRWLDPRATLALTINACGRCRSSTADTLFRQDEGKAILSNDPQSVAVRFRRAVLSLCRRYRFRYSEKSFAKPYTNWGENLKSEPMILLTVVGLGKKESHDAYEEE